MKIRRNIWGALILAFTAVMASCGSGDNGHPDEFVIRGKLKNSRGEKIHLRQLCNDSISNIDSANVGDEGDFIFRGKVIQPAFYLVGTGMNNFVTLLIDKGEEVGITGDAMQLARDYEVTGSPGSQLLWELNRHTRNNYKLSDSIYSLLVKSQSRPDYDSIKRAVDSSFGRIFEEQREYVRSFIKGNTRSLASLMALYQVFGQRKVVNEKDDFGLFDMLDQGLREKYPGNAYVVELSKRVDRLKTEEMQRVKQEARLDSGNFAPEIDLKTLNGVPVTLSSLKGRTVLVYFWAGSSAESQKPVTFYKYLNKAYGSKGFTILAVSLDKDRQTWEMAVRQNKMSWIQASDLMEWTSPLVKSYNITSIPVSFLIDKEGRILCKRPDDETLTRFLARIYRY